MENMCEMRILITGNWVVCRLRLRLYYIYVNAKTKMVHD